MKFSQPRIGNRCYLEALIVPKINTSRRQPDYIDLPNNSQLADLPVVTGPYPNARILIGLDNDHLLLPYETRSCRDDCENVLFAEKTFLGWTLRARINEFVFDRDNDKHDMLRCDNDICSSCIDSRDTFCAGEQYDGEADTIILPLVSDTKIVRLRSSVPVSTRPLPGNSVESEFTSKINTNLAVEDNELSVLQINEEGILSNGYDRMNFLSVGPLHNCCISSTKSAKSSLALVNKWTIPSFQRSNH